MSRSWQRTIVPKKFRGLKMVSIIPRKKVLIPRHSEVYGRDNFEAQNGRKWHDKNISFTKKSCSSKLNVFVRDSLGEFASSFVPRNGIPSCFLLSGMFRNRIPSVCFYFCSTEWNTELFSLPQNSSEWNPASLLLFLFRGTEFRVFFSSAERFGTEFKEFSFARNSRNSARTNQLFRLFHLPRHNFFVGNCQPYPEGRLQVSNYMLTLLESTARRLDAIES